MTGIRILEVRALRKGGLLGFAKVELPSGMILADVAILTGERGPWASPPSKPIINRDGQALKDASGRIRYQAIVEFRDKATRDRWSAAIIEALRQAHPESLG